MLPKHGWDMVKVWIFKGEDSHSNCISVPFSLLSERYLNPENRLWPEKFHPWLNRERKNVWSLRMEIFAHFLSFLASLPLQFGFPLMSKQSVSRQSPSFWSQKEYHLLAFYTNSILKTNGQGFRVQSWSNNIQCVKHKLTWLTTHIEVWDFVAKTQRNFKSAKFAITYEYPEEKRKEKEFILFFDWGLWAH